MPYTPGATRVAIHVNGDTTIDTVLKAYERSRRGAALPEHCSLLNLESGSSTQGPRGRF